MIKVIAVDDEPLALEIIKSYSDNLRDFELIKTFTNTVEAQNYLDKFPVDLIFLDVNMPEISGIDFYRSLSRELMVILTTAHSEYALDGFELSAVDFLLKPYSFERFLVAVNKAKDFHDYSNNRDRPDANHIYIRSEYSLMKVPVDDISYVEGLADYMKIHLIDGKTLITRMTMKAIATKLPEKKFIRVHRSFIVSIARIDSVRNKTIHIGRVEIPIGVRHEGSFFKVFGEK